MRCPKCDRAYARQLFSSVMCIHTGCSNYDWDWDMEVIDKVLPLEVWSLRDRFCGNPLWYPKEFKFLSDPIKYSIDGEDWVWAVGRSLSTMHGVKISCPISPPAPHFFQNKLAKRAKDGIETMGNGFDAGLIPGRISKADTMSKWSKDLYAAQWGPNNKSQGRPQSYTKVVEGNKVAFFHTKNLLNLLGGEPEPGEGGGIYHKGISPTKVALTDDAVFCAARTQSDFVAFCARNGMPGMGEMVAVTAGFSKLESRYAKYVNAEIVLG